MNFSFNSIESIFLSFTLDDYTIWFQVKCLKKTERTESKIISNTLKTFACCYERISTINGTTSAVCCVLFLILKQLRSSKIHYFTLKLIDSLLIFIHLFVSILSVFFMLYILQQTFIAFHHFSHGKIYTIRQTNAVVIIAWFEIHIVFGFFFYFLRTKKQKQK